MLLSSASWEAEKNKPEWVVSSRQREGRMAGEGRPPAENMKEDIFTAREVKDTLGGLRT